jgi:lipopolysaccharide/colanic/teichoic acid biosynthesis glycosyltransferase
MTETPELESTLIRGFRQLAAASPPRGRDVVLRVMDVTLSAFFLIVLSPISVLIVLAIFFTDGRPIFYAGERVGQGGRIFKMFKFRTLKPDAETRLGPYLGAELVARTEAEYTSIGRWLKATQLDEIPQLWNVLRGDMSLVGPRPTLAYQVERYTPRQRRRLEVKPGLTGWAQIHGRARLPWEERIELDVWYVDHRSPWLDLKILARTPRALFAGTYKGDSGGWSA